MTLISFTFYKEYFYFLCYWIIDLIDALEGYIFEYKNNIPSEEKYPKENSLINLNHLMLIKFISRNFSSLYLYYNKCIQKKPKSKKEK